MKRCAEDNNGVRRTEVRFDSSPIDQSVSSSAESDADAAESSLRRAIETDQLEQFNQALVRLYSRPLTADDHKRFSTLLHLACEWHRPKMLEKLAGNMFIDLCAHNEQHETALDLAVRKRDDECVDVLLRNRHTRGVENLVPRPCLQAGNLWHEANRLGLASIVRLLAYDDDDAPAKSRVLTIETTVACLVSAIQGGQNELVEFWLSERGADTNLFVHDLQSAVYTCPLWACADTENFELALRLVMRHKAALGDNVVLDSGRKAFFLRLLGQLSRKQLDGTEADADIDADAEAEADVNSGAYADVLSCVDVQLQSGVFSLLLPRRPAPLPPRPSNQDSETVQVHAPTEPPSPSPSPAPSSPTGPQTQLARFLFGRLRQIDFRDNRLEELPPAVFRLASLESLLVAHNRIAAIRLPPNAAECSRLRVLDCSSQRDGFLRSVPLALLRLPSLRKLDLSNNAIWTLLDADEELDCPPASASNQPNRRQSSTLTRNRVVSDAGVLLRQQSTSHTDLPSRLIELDLSSNLLDSDALGKVDWLKFPKLELLNLSHNPNVTEMPPVFRSPLTTLNLSHTKIGSIVCRRCDTAAVPPAADADGKARRTSILKQPSRTDSNEADCLFELEWAESLRSLDISHTPLSKLSDCVTRLRGVMSLDATGCAQLRSIPSAKAWRCSRLRTLLLDCCALSNAKPTSGGLPGELGLPACAASTMRHLGLRGNHLDRIPPDLLKFKKLETLDLRDTCPSFTGPEAELLPTISALSHLFIDSRALDRTINANSSAQRDRERERERDKDRRRASTADETEQTALANGARLLSHFSSLNDAPNEFAKISVIGSQKSAKRALINALIPRTFTNSLSAAWTSNNSAAINLGAATSDSGIHVLQCEWDIERDAASAATERRPDATTRPRSRNEAARVHVSVWLFEHPPAADENGATEGDVDADAGLLSRAASCCSAQLEAAFYTPNGLFILTFDAALAALELESIRLYLTNVQVRAPNAAVLIVGVTDLLTANEVAAAAGARKRDREQDVALARANEIAARVRELYCDSAANDDVGLPEIVGVIMVNTRVEADRERLAVTVRRAIAAMRECDASPTRRRRSRVAQRFLLEKRVPAAFCSLRRFIEVEARRRERDGEPSVLSEASIERWRTSSRSVSDAVCDAALRYLVDIGVCFAVTRSSFAALHRHVFLDAPALHTALTALHSSVFAAYLAKASGHDRQLFMRHALLDVGLLRSFFDAHRDLSPSHSKASTSTNKDQSLLTADAKLQRRLATVFAAFKFEEYVELLEHFSVATQITEQYLLVAANFQPANIAARSFRFLPIPLHSKPDCAPADAGGASIVGRIYLFPSHLPTDFWNRLVVRLIALLVHVLGVNVDSLIRSLAPAPANRTQRRPYWVQNPQNLNGAAESSAVFQRSNRFRSGIYQRARASVESSATSRTSYRQFTLSDYRVGWNRSALRVAHADGLCIIESLKLLPANASQLSALHQSVEASNASRQDYDALVSSLAAAMASGANTLQRAAVLDDAFSDATMLCAFSCTKTANFIPFGMFIDELDALITEVYPGDTVATIRRFAPCTSCMQAAVQRQNMASEMSGSGGNDSVVLVPESLDMRQMMSSSFWFSYYDCVRATIDTGSESDSEQYSDVRDVKLLCPVEKRSLALAQLVPDVLLLDVDYSATGDASKRLLALDARMLECRFDPAALRGAGGFSTVYAARYDGRPVALKIPHYVISTYRHVLASRRRSLENRRSDGGTGTDEVLGMMIASYAHDLAEVRHETRLMNQLRHPNVITLIGVLHRPCLCFALELAVHGSLQGLITARLTAQREADADCDAETVFEPFASFLLLRIALQVVAALRYLHSKAIVYTDLKTDNLLVTRFDESHGIVCVKLTDYGISRQRFEYRGVFADEARGTPGYAAPELCTGAAFYTDKVDLFAFGMLLYELVTLQRPFAAASLTANASGGSLELINRVAAGFRPSLRRAATCSPRKALRKAEARSGSRVIRLIRSELLALELAMQWCWQEAPDSRPSAAELRHRLVRSFDTAQLCSIAHSENETAGHLPAECDERYLTKAGLFDFTSSLHFDVPAAGADDAAIAADATMRRRVKPTAIRNATLVPKFHDFCASRPSGRFFFFWYCDSGIDPAGLERPSSSSDVRYVMVVDGSTASRLEFDAPGYLPLAGGSNALERFDNSVLVAVLSGMRSPRTLDIYRLAFDGSTGSVSRFELAISTKIQHSTSVYLCLPSCCSTPASVTHVADVFTFGDDEGWLHRLRLFAKPSNPDFKSSKLADELQLPFELSEPVDIRVARPLPAVTNTSVNAIPDPSVSSTATIAGVREKVLCMLLVRNFGGQLWCGLDSLLVVYKLESLEPLEHIELAVFDPKRRKVNAIVSNAFECESVDLFNDVKCQDYKGSCPMRRAPAFVWCSFYNDTEIWQFSLEHRTLICRFDCSQVSVGTTCFIDKADSRFDSTSRDRSDSLAVNFAQSSHQAKATSHIRWHNRGLMLQMLTGKSVSFTPTRTVSSQHLSSNTTAARSNIVASQLADPQTCGNLEVSSMEYAAGQLWVGRNLSDVVVIDVDVNHARHELEQKLSKSAPEPRGAPSGLVQRAVQEINALRQLGTGAANDSDGNYGVLSEYGAALRLIDCARAFTDFLDISSAENIDFALRPLYVRNIVRRMIRRRDSSEWHMCVLNRWRFVSPVSPLQRHSLVDRADADRQSDAVTITEWRILQPSDYRSVTSIFNETDV